MLAFTRSSNNRQSVIRNSALRLATVTSHTMLKTLQGTVCSVQQ